MKFHYWKKLLIALIFSLGLFSSQFFITNFFSETVSDFAEFGNNRGKVYIYFRERGYVRENSSYQVIRGKRLFDHIELALTLLRDKPELQGRNWRDEAQKNLESALDILVDSRTLEIPTIEKIATGKDKSGSRYLNSAIAASSVDSEIKKIDVNSVLTLTASFVAIVATISTILLSWRKDIREAKAEIRRLKEEAPKIHIP